MLSVKNTRILSVGIK